ncbi:MAG TPA: hypothetical protein VF337_03840 [Candidatus Limnocylindrales bacterium]
MTQTEQNPSKAEPVASRGGPIWGRISAPAAILGGLFVAFLVAAAVLFRPWATPGMGYDSAASVLYFDRLAAHRTLEGFVGTTPKPAITILYGLAFNLLHDWRLIALMSTVFFAAMLVTAASLAWRTAGPLAAGLAAFGLLGSQLLLLDGALAYSNPLAILMWLVAGLALTSSSPRYGLAGLVLFLAALMRIETFIILAVAAAALGTWRFLPQGRLLGHSRPPARAMLLLLGVLALPLMVVHDLLLTGHGLFWLDVSAIYSKTYQATVLTPLQLNQFLVRYYSGAWPLALLAAAAVVDLVRRRRVVVLLGLLACGPGVIAFLELLAIKGTYVSNRYTIPADAALVFAAALGAEALARAAAAYVVRRRSMPAPATRLMASQRGRDKLAVAGAAVAIGAMVAVAFVRPYGPLDHETWTAINKYRALQANYETIKPALTAAIAALPDQPTWTSTDVEQMHSPLPPRLYVPSMLLPRLTVDLNMPVWAIRDGSPVLGNASNLQVSVRSIVYIDARQGADPVGDDEPLEVDRATRVGHVMVTPILVNAGAGLWLVQLDPVAA